MLTWVNGIAHNLDHMANGQTSISSLFGGRPVVFCHNPTAMTGEGDYRGYIGDLTQAGTQKLGRITAEVDALVRYVRTYQLTVLYTRSVTAPTSICKIIFCRLWNT